MSCTYKVSEVCRSSATGTILNCGCVIVHRCFYTAKSTNISIDSLEVGNGSQQKKHAGEVADRSYCHDPWAVVSAGLVVSALQENDPTVQDL